MSAEEASFPAAVAGLQRGDFSALAPLFEETPDTRSQIGRWVVEGHFSEQPEVLAEALTCASFLGKTGLVRLLLARGLAPLGGAGTGLNALHWAVNRGQLDVARLLLEAGASLEVRNMYGGDVLSTATWSAIHEPRPAHLPVIELLLQAGARPEGHPTGVDVIDQLLARYAAGSPERTDD